MWYDPVAFRLGKSDVIGAWLVSFVFGAACLLIMAAAPGRPGRSAALTPPGPSLAAAGSQGKQRC
jgi:hypothetical protein